MQIDFTNKIVLITGATRGIGKAIADCFFQSGATLILTGTQKEEIELLNKQNKSNGINNIEYVQANFSNRESVDSFLNKLMLYEHIDICVNNAGVNRVNNFTDTSTDDFDWIHNINLKVPYQILSVVGPKMLEQGYGRIVNVASIWSWITTPGRSMYTSSKNALVGLTKTLAVEWASRNVLVNAVSPGFTLTELTKTTNTKEQLIELQNKIPVGRLAEPIEIAKLVAFLCSDLNTYITGQNIIIDGGFTNV